jgi:hypothetical protein
VTARLWLSLFTLREAITMAPESKTLQQMMNFGLPTAERQTELEAAYQQNLAAGRPAYAGVEIRTGGEVLWIFFKRRWSATPWDDAPSGERPAGQAAHELAARLSGARVFGIDLSSAVAEEDLTRTQQAMADAFQSPPDLERQAVLEAAYRANITARRPLYQGVEIRTGGELQWIMRQRHWSWSSSPLDRLFHRPNLDGALILGLNQEGDVPADELARPIIALVSAYTKQQDILLAQSRFLLGYRLLQALLLVTALYLAESIDSLVAAAFTSGLQVFLQVSAWQRALSANQLVTLAGDAPQIVLALVGAVTIVVGLLFTRYVVGVFIAPLSRFFRAATLQQRVARLPELAVMGLTEWAAQEHERLEHLEQIQRWLAKDSFLQEAVQTHLTRQHQRAGLAQVALLPALAAVVVGTAAALQDRFKLWPQPLPTLVVLSPGALYVMAATLGTIGFYLWALFRFFPFLVDKVLQQMVARGLFGAPLTGDTSAPRRQGSIALNVVIILLFVASFVLVGTAYLIGR